MKKIAMFTLAATLSLGSCATTGGGVTTNSIQAEIAAIQQVAVNVEKGGCGFLPTAATVSAILATLAPSTATIDQTIVSVAQQICTAVLPLKAKLGKRLGGAAPPTVNGVVIHGRFVS